MRDDLVPAGTIVEVLVGEPDEMERRGHEQHLVAHLGSPPPPRPAAAATPVWSPA